MTVDFSGVTINRILDLNHDYDRLFRFTILCFDFGSIIAHLFQGALSELLYRKIGTQNTLNCAFMIDKQRQ